jgi:DNA repair protein RadC
MIAKDRELAYIPKIGLTKRKSSYKPITIRSPREAVDYIRQFYRTDISLYESAFILLLNKQLQTIGYAKISQGGISSTIVDVSIVAKYCVDTLASSCIFAHNHPSGNLEPSEADRKMTTRMKEALALFECTLQDSLILTETESYSIIHGTKLS